MKAGELRQQLQQKTDGGISRSALNVSSFKGKPCEWAMTVPILQKKRLRLAEGMAATRTGTQIAGRGNDALPASPQGASLRDSLRKGGRLSVVGKGAHAVPGIDAAGADQQEGARPGPVSADPALGQPPCTRPRSPTGPPRAPAPAPLTAGPSPATWTNHCPARPPVPLSTSWLQGPGARTKLSFPAGAGEPCWLSEFTPRSTVLAPRTAK